MRRVDLRWASMTRSILERLEPRQQRVDVRFHEAGPEPARATGGAGAAGRDTPRRPEELVLDPELVGNRGVELLRGRVAVHRVEDSAAVVDKRLEDLLERGGIRARHVVRERESDDREHLTGGRNGALNELSARLLKCLQCAEQLRRERQRSASADGDSEKVATVDHEALRVGVHAVWSHESGTAQTKACQRPVHVPSTERVSIPARGRCSELHL